MEVRGGRSADVGIVVGLENVCMDTIEREGEREAGRERGREGTDESNGVVVVDNHLCLVVVVVVVVVVVPVVLVGRCRYSCLLRFRVTPARCFYASAALLSLPFLSLESTAVVIAPHNAENRKNLDT